VSRHSFSDVNVPIGSDVDDDAGTLPAAREQHQHHQQQQRRRRQVAAASIVFMLGSFVQPQTNEYDSVLLVINCSIQNISILCRLNIS
jgi:hypothetical protein